VLIATAGLGGVREVLSWSAMMTTSRQLGAVGDCGRALADGILRRLLDAICE